MVWSRQGLLGRDGMGRAGLGWVGLGWARLVRPIWGLDAKLVVASLSSARARGTGCTCAAAVAAAAAAADAAAAAAAATAAAAAAAAASLTALSSASWRLTSNASSSRAWCSATRRFHLASLCHTGASSLSSTSESDQWNARVDSMPDCCCRLASTVAVGGVPGRSRRWALRVAIACADIIGRRAGSWESSSLGC